MRYAPAIFLAACIPSSTPVIYANGFVVKADAGVRERSDAAAVAVEAGFEQAVRWFAARHPRDGVRDLLRECRVFVFADRSKLPGLRERFDPPCEIQAVWESSDKPIVLRDRIAHGFGHAWLRRYRRTIDWAPLTAKYGTGGDWPWNVDPEHAWMREEGFPW